MADMDLLRRLCTARGVSGRETEVAALIRQEAAPWADELDTDPSGNVIALRRGRSSEHRVLVTSHMDEIGFYVVNITEEGLLQLDVVGGMDPRVLYGKRVLVGERRLPGCVGAKPVHQRTAEERKKAVALDKMYVDIGASSREEAEEAVMPGDAVTFASDFVPFGDGRIKARALDNRCGCLASLLAMRQQPLYDTVFAFTVQEEIGLRGAIPAAFAAAPDLCINLDATTAADLPGVPEHLTSCAVGRGVVVYLMESRTLYRPEWLRAAVATAERHGIPWQYKNAVTGGTDAGVVHISRAGVPTVSLSAPVRMLHSPAGITSTGDVDALCRLTAALLQETNVFFDGKGE